MVKLLRFTLIFLWISYASLANTITKDSIHNNLEYNKLNLKKGSKTLIASLKTNLNLKVKTSRTFKEFTNLDISEKNVNNFQKKQIEEGFNFKAADSSLNKKWLQIAKNTFATIEQSQNYIDLLTEDDLSSLPVATRPKEISNIKYTMGVAKAVFKPAFTELIVFLKVETPKGTLYLGAKDIKLSHEGGIIGEAKLSLISQFTMKIDDGKAIVILKGSFQQPFTYALIDCSGFNELSVDADVLFSQGLIHPVDKDGNKIGGYVQSSFRTVITDWNDLVVNISLPEFGINGLKGTTFRLNSAVLDFSDIRNDPLMPGAYLSKYYNNNPNLWRGVYINSLQVVLPKAFKKKNQDKRISFGATNLIIDSQGITGTFIGEDIFSIDEGSASKWKFSLDRFALGIEANTLTMGEFNGELVLPVSKVERLQYNAIIGPDEYTLQVSSTNAIQFDVWNAEVTLNPESYIEMKVKDGKFLPKANLHGTVNLASGLGDNSNQQSENKTVNFQGIKFENMLLQTEGQKFSVEYFGYKGNLKLAGFPLTINEIGLQTPQGSNRANLIFDFNINLTSESDGGNGAGSKLIFAGKLEDDNGRDQWKFDRVELERMMLAMEVGGTKLAGAIFIFDDDPTYGTGFAGSVSAKFGAGLNLEVQAKALFGRTQEFRYWFADAQAVIPGGVPIFTGFALNTFGGGIYNRMKMAGVSNDPNAAMNHIGASSSGVIYEPSSSSGLGMKAMVGIATQNSEDLFHATLEFGMTFAKSGKINDIYFRGRGELLSPPTGNFAESVLEKLAKIALEETVSFPSTPPSGAMSADVFISFDFANDIFHATSDVFVNFGVLKGYGNYGRAGWLDFYASPDEWHMLIGTPEDPIGIVLNIGILKIETTSYFMTGENLPNSPPPSPMVSEILGIDAAKLDYTRDLGQLKSGLGLAFGANVSVDTGDLKFLIFYARFQAGLGFDVMIKDYGEARCKGSSGPIGLNGWYANGQAYAYLQGELGLFFKLFGSKKRIPIIKGGGAVIVQARLPNPAWFQGYMGGHYNLLGGLIKGKFRFKLEIGEKCEIVGGSPIEGIVAIGDMSPKDNKKDVDVFASPQVVFNMQLNKVFEIPDETGDRKYRIMLDHFKVTKDGQLIKGEIKWSDQNDVAIFQSHEILPPKSNITSAVQLHFEEFKNGRWEVIKEDGKVSLESKEVTFTTGEAPKTIPKENIVYMYPVIEQQNFFIKEYNLGYIKLEKGQEYLFQPVPNWKKTLIMKGSDGQELETTFSYNASKKQVAFPLPKGMNRSTAYEVKVVLIPPKNDMQSNVTTTEVRKDLNEDTNITVRSRKAEGVVISGEERELLTYTFKTSEFNTFQKRINAMRENKELYYYLTYPYGLALVSSVDDMEAFDLAELVGNEYTGNQPLIRVKAVLDNPYYLQNIYPLLYKGYPFREDLTIDRKTDKISIPPVEGVEPMSWYLDYLENNYTGETRQYNPYRYNLTYYFHQDYEAIRYKLVNSGQYDTPGIPRKLVTDPFPLMRNGKYKTELKYVLPGQVNTGRSQQIKYTNPLYE
ncbi:hypothetical protein NBT05_12805 [Aquimarina sp. ERC-38]|uniref:hypothetical protein n=1 Tax=Aquimarina sp. ERC-38 TaxID=2949996 RepID=UPI0022457D0B|nr:hypothetical protein [Aquimarina sp. ERC-38]UZO79829.1 hypothetical protein NBT05_12805 [Aquimarina sp. ERC-38]